MMDYCNFVGFPLAGEFFYDDDTAYFNSLPEDLQRELLAHDIHSRKEFHDCVQRLKQMR